MDNIYVKDLMIANVVSIAPNALLIDVLKSMIDHRHSCMVVVDNNMPIGIVTERDIVRLMAEFLNNKPQPPIHVVDVMSVPVVTVKEETTLFEALVISSAQKIRHLPVVDMQGRLLGLVTQSDLAKAHFQVFERQREIIESSISTRTQELQLAHDQLKALSMMDALMGIGNRRAMEVDLDHTHALALRYKRSYAVMLFDVDFFKLYNDNYGHPAGDEALRQISTYLQSCIRKSDRLYRYGGEEILMLLPETPRDGAMILADRIIAGFAALNITHDASPLKVLTMSCGVACEDLEPAFTSWQDVVSRADTLLYESKHSGRNRATGQLPSPAA